MDATKSYHYLNFPPNRAIGTLYERQAGKKRWNKCADARGQIHLATNKEYRLKLSSYVHGADDVAAILTGVDCDLLYEIEMSFWVAREDISDQIYCGNYWLDEFLDEKEWEILSKLKTKAKIVFRTVDLSDKLYRKSLRHYEGENKAVLQNGKEDAPAGENT